MTRHLTHSKRYLGSLSWYVFSEFHHHYYFGSLSWYVFSQFRHHYYNREANKLQVCFFPANTLLLGLQVLKSCTTLKTLPEGRKLHMEIAKEAQDIFHSLPSLAQNKSFSSLMISLQGLTMVIWHENKDNSSCFLAPKLAYAKCVVELLFVEKLITCLLHFWLYIIFIMPIQLQRGNNSNFRTLTNNLIQYI